MDQISLQKFDFENAFQSQIAFYPFMACDIGLNWLWGSFTHCGFLFFYPFSLRDS